MTLRNIAESLINKCGYDLSLYRVAPKQYEGKSLAFIHIAKCGGTSVDLALRSALAAPNERRINRDATIAASLNTFAVSQHQLASNIEQQTAFSEHHARQLQTVLAYHLGLNWRFVSGHVAISTAILDGYQSQYDFVTVLRDPIQRFVSNYIYNKMTNTSHIMPPNALSQDNLIAEAQQILTSKRGWHMANTNTMFLTGRYPKDAADALAMQQEVAINLSKFSVVGFLDNLADFEQQCTALTGRNINIGQHNVTSRFEDEQQQIAKNTLKDFFADKSTQQKLNKLCASELANFNNAQDKYGS